MQGVSLEPHTVKRDPERHNEVANLIANLVEGRRSGQVERHYAFEAQSHQTPEALADVQRVVHFGREPIDTRTIVKSVEYARAQLTKSQVAGYFFLTFGWTRAGTG